MTRTTPLLLSASALCALVLCAPGAASACSLIAPLFEVDESLASTDTDAPAAPEFDLVSVQRGTGGCGAGVVDTCTEFAVVRFELSADYAEAVGFTLEPVGDGAPELLFGNEDGTFVGTSDSTSLDLYWSDGRDDEQEPVDFELSFVAVDRAGNRSEPSVPVRITHDGVADCPPDPPATCEFFDDFAIDTSLVDWGGATEAPEIIDEEWFITGTNCNQFRSTCSGISSIRYTLDNAYPEAVGSRVVTTTGDEAYPVPADLREPRIFPVASDGTVTIVWNDDESSAWFDLEFEMQAVDRAGNASTTVTRDFEYGRSDCHQDCSTAPFRSSGVMLLLAVLGMVVRRQRS